MKEYLKMSDAFDCEVESDADLMYSDSLGNIADFSGYKTQCKYASHAINSHDELVEINKELLCALENLLDDMRLRAKLEGDVDSDGTVILNCGNGVLFAATMAIEKAK